VKKLWESRLYFVNRFALAGVGSQRHPLFQRSAEFPTEHLSQKIESGISFPHFSTDPQRSSSSQAIYKVFYLFAFVTVLLAVDMSVAQLARRSLPIRESNSTACLIFHSSFLVPALST
jgi:hypothetical protein